MPSCWRRTACMPICITCSLPRGLIDVRTHAASMTGRRTLVISPNWIGDAVMAQPLLRLLKDRQPERPIDVLAPAFLAPVWRAMPEVDTVLESHFKHGALQLR